MRRRAPYNPNRAKNVELPRAVRIADRALDAFRRLGMASLGILPSQGGGTDDGSRFTEPFLMQSPLSLHGSYVSDDSVELDRRNLSSRSGKCLLTNAAPDLTCYLGIQRFQRNQDR
jgi:hypothetical protein